VSARLKASGIITLCVRIVEKPEDKELAFLFKKYGRTKFRSIHWDMRNKEERKD